ncbi:DDE-type integrase/transposase/recombinase [Patescibacteria group bacterium]|nr:DDE-type integrase/transposase/recombinase [Patescibacteria group bacterium]
MYFIMNNTQTYRIPYGFHAVNDLLPIAEMSETLERGDISREARRRLQWMDHYHQYNNASLTCRYFGISRKTFYYWKNRYDPLNPKTLEDKSKRPLNLRKWEVSRKQELKVIKLRKQYIRYGKEKLRILYQREYNETISSWKIQRVIEKHNLYYYPVKTAKLRKKRRLSQHKKRITELQKEQRTGFLIAIDGVTIHWNGIKRYILTALDVYSKIGFARMYKSKQSANASDFLQRVYYLLDGKIENLLTDNGSEFEKDFWDAVEGLGIDRWYSRPRTPQDNPCDERFNRTLEEEFIQLGNFDPEPKVFNRLLTEWLIEYNLYRPHQSLGYKMPIEFQNQHHKVLPMYPSSTGY